MFTILHFILILLSVKNLVLVPRSHKYLIVSGPLSVMSGVRTNNEVECEGDRGQGVREW